MRQIMQLGEVEGCVRREDRRIFWEVPIIRVVQRVVNEVTSEHLHFSWRRSIRSQFASCHSFVACMLLRVIVEREERRAVVVEPVLVLWLRGSR